MRPSGCGGSGKPLVCRIATRPFRRRAVIAAAIPLSAEAVGKEE
jgi:hypothetical protein